jgi:hypothetical protein
MMRPLHRARPEVHDGTVRAELALLVFAGLASGAVAAWLAGPLYRDSIRALTSVLGIYHGAEAMSILGVPEDKGWTMACCVSLGYPTGRWAVAARRPVHEVASRNSWDGDLGLQIPEPLWPGASEPDGAP